MNSCNIHHRKINNTLMTLGGLGVIIYFFLSHCIHHEISSYIRPNQKFFAVFNSNQLFIPHLYQDIVIQGASLRDWTLPPVPFLFPDAFIFFLIAPIFHHLETTILLSNAILACLYYTLMVTVGTHVCTASALKKNPTDIEKYKNFFRFSTLLSLFLACNHLHEYEIMAPFWSSHFGSTVVVYLACLLFILKILQSSRTGLYTFFLSMFVFFTGVSDPFFGVLLLGSVAPALLSLKLHNSIKSSLLFYLFLWLFFVAGLAFLCNMHDWLHLQITSFTHLTTNTAPTIHFTWTSVHVLHKIFRLYYAQNPIILMISLGMIFVGLRLFIAQTTLNSSIVFIIICVTFSILVTIFASLFLDQDLLQPNFLSLRHFQSPILLPTFLCVPILLTSCQSLIDRIDRYYWFLILLLISSLFLFQPHDTLKKMLHVYPPLTRCLDNYAKQGKLINKNGIATYWNARVNSLLSKENLNIVAINRYEKPYNWMSTKHNYRHKKFHFVIIKTPILSPDRAIKHWGNPDTILGCPHADNDQIFVYNAGFYIE